MSSDREAKSGPSAANSASTTINPLHGEEALKDT
jgi:hypothetical protein